MVRGKKPKICRNTLKDDQLEIFGHFLKQKKKKNEKNKHNQRLIKDIILEILGNFLNKKKKIIINLTI